MTKTLKNRVLLPSVLTLLSPIVPYFTWESSPGPVSAPRPIRYKVVQSGHIGISFVAGSMISGTVAPYFEQFSPRS